MRSLDPVIEGFLCPGEQQIALDRARGLGENLTATCSHGTESSCLFESAADLHEQKTTDLVSSSSASSTSY